MWKSYAIIILFATAYWIGRVYAITPYWDGTDGNGQLANIFLYNIHGPYYLESSWANGNPSYTYPSHPAVLYEIPRLVGMVLNPLFRIEDDDSVTCAIAIKLISAVTQFIFFSILIWHALTCDFKSSEARYYFCLAVILISLSPLALMSSNEFQTDTFSGPFLIGGATLLLLVGHKPGNKYASNNLTLILAGILLGCGKSEWSLAFLLATFAVGIVGLLSHDRGIFSKAGILCAALIGGNLLSCAVDFKNYWGGCSLMSKMITEHSALGASHPYNFDYTFFHILPYTITICVLIGFAFVMALFERKEIQAEHLMLFFSGTALFIGFALSSWGLVSRYFYPSLLLLSGLVCILSKSIRSKEKVQLVMIPLLAVLLMSDLYFDFTLFQHAGEVRKWHEDHGPLVLQPLKENEAYLLDICFLLPKVDKNFVHAWVGEPTISDLARWAHKDLKRDGIKEYPPHSIPPYTFTDGQMVPNP